MKMIRNISLWALALSVFPVSALAGPSIGDMANNIFAPTAFLTKLALIACYVIGAALIFTSIAQYKIHLQSPKLVPLSTPIVLLILGLITVMIPFSSRLFGDTYSAAENTSSAGQDNSLPLPDLSEERKGPALPIPSRKAQPATPAPAPAPAPANNYPVDNSQPDNSGSDGHWTSDPRYNQ